MYKPFANIEQVVCVIALSIAVRARLLFLARDRAIAGAGRRNLRANYLRSHAYPLRAPVPAAIIPSLAYVGHVFRRYTFEDIDRRVSPSVTVAATTLPAGNYSYSLFSAEACTEQKPSREMQNAGRWEGKGTQRGYALLSGVSRNSAQRRIDGACGHVARNIRTGYGFTEITLCPYTSYHLTPCRTL